MKFSIVRALILAVISLPLGFILTALGFAVTQSTIEASAIFPWALAIAVAAGGIGGIRRASPQSPKNPMPTKPS